MLCGLVLIVADGAGAASFRVAAPLSRSSASGVGCVSSTADGKLVVWRDPHRVIRAGSLAEGATAAAIGTADFCPDGATAPDGSAVLSLRTTPRDDADGVQFALRSAPGRFGPFTPVAVLPGVSWRHSGLAIGGSVVAFGARAGGGSDTPAFPVLVVRASDGQLRTVPLPGGTGKANIDELVGPVTGVDGAGRGLVMWGALRAAGGQLLAASFDGAGTLGPPQVLAANGVDDVFNEPALAVGGDGSAAAGWVSRGRTTVVTGTTGGGLDSASATATPVRWRVDVEPSGAAVAVGSASSVRGDRMVLATRAAGRPFSAARSYRADGVGDWEPEAAVHDGRYIVAFTARLMISPGRLGRLQAVTGRAGDPAPAAVTVPVSSARVTGYAVALPRGGPATVLTRTVRESCVDCAAARRQFRIDPFHYSARPPRRPSGVRVLAQPRQRLGDRQALRVEIVCPGRCAVRVAGSARHDAFSSFDASRILPAGRTVLRVPAVDRLRSAARVRLEIAVDDAAGELRVRRSVLAEP
jgi:hypothetical protein